MKSHRFVAGSVVLLLFIVPCSANQTATNTGLQTVTVSRVADQKTARSVDCRDAGRYKFVVVGNPNRKKASDPVIPKDLNIVDGSEVVSKLELPKESEVKNFSLNSVRRTETGFEVKVNWGGGLDHYELQFNFRCKANNFYLFKVKKERFSTTNPASGKFLDKKETKETRIEPNLPIGKFVMTDYLQFPRSRRRRTRWTRAAGARLVT